jgi:hypothetical protein
VDFPTLDFRLYLQNLLYVPFNILFILQGSYIKSIDEIKRFLNYVANDKIRRTFAAKTTLGIER